MRYRKRPKGRRRSTVLTPAWAVLVALGPAVSHAESPPVRPAPPEKAPDAKQPIKIFGTGPYQRLAPPRLAGTARIQPLSLAQKTRLIGRDAGSHHVTLTIANAVVQNKASLDFLDPDRVDPLHNYALLGAHTGGLYLRLNTQANKTYWIEVIVGRWATVEECGGFRVFGPDNSVQDFNCTEAFRKDTDAQHLLFGFSAAASDQFTFKLVAHQKTVVYRYEITVQ